MTIRPLIHSLKLYYLPYIMARKLATAPELLYKSTLRDYLSDFSSNRIVNGISLLYLKLNKIYYI